MDKGKNSRNLKETERTRSLNLGFSQFSLCSKLTTDVVGGQVATQSKKKNAKKRAQLGDSGGTVEENHFGYVIR
jgi:hypothetical protein